MINRENWKDIKAYLHYVRHVRQNSDASVDRVRDYTRHLLEWADETSFAKVRAIDPSFPTYLLTARADGKSKPLSPISMTKTLHVVRHFFEFARTEWPLRYKTVSPSWVEMLQLPRHARPQSRLVHHDFYTLEDILKIAAVSTETLREERAKTGMCMLFISGMRAGALGSVPISCVDLDAKQIHQLPERGVLTKNSKAAITYLLPIPQLMEVVQSWDRRLRQAHPQNSLWYSALNREGMELKILTHAYSNGPSTIRHDVRLICEKAGVPYRSPHQLRHGHVRYAVKLARSLDDYKAISENVMHSTIATTEGYGKMNQNEIEKVINSLVQQQQPSKGVEEKLDELMEMLKRRLLPGMGD